MLWYLKTKDAIAVVKQNLTDAYMTQALGIGKLEKSAAIGEARICRRLLTVYLGVSPREIAELRERSFRTAESNLISYSSKRED